MPITAAQLEQGDILFKHASDSLVSDAIREGQKAVYRSLLTRPGVGPSPMGQQEAIDITHVAIAAGQDDVLEFDEGGASLIDILFRKGFGFVRGNMSMNSRRGNRYEVFKCTDGGLKALAADKAELLWDISHQVGRETAGFQSSGPIRASYGVRKVVETGLLGEAGKKYDTVHDFERALDRWLSAATSGNKPNVQFFCSEFVSFCYLWAAASLKKGKILGADFLFGFDRARIAPVELYTRIETVGKSNFSFKGTLYTPR